MEHKLKKEIDLFSTVWKGGFFNDINKDPRKLYKIKEEVIDNFLKENMSVLEIGCGRGAWTKNMLKAKHIYTLDALSAEHNGFWEYVGSENKDKITYNKVYDFKCADIPDNSIDFLFSYDVFCHISYSGMKEYMKNLYPKLKKGAKCFVMVADYDKYKKSGLWDKYINAWNKEKEMLGYNSLESMISDFDGDNVKNNRVRWFWYGNDRFCDVLRENNYQIIEKDMNLIEKDPICFFIKHE